MAGAKNIDELMNYLRDVRKINIKGKYHRKKLKTLGYYHSYKGYRFVKDADNALNFSDFNEIIALNEFDMNVKSLFYPKIMFLETALKNYVLDIILQECNTSSFIAIYDTIVTEHKTYTVGSNNYDNALNKRLRLRDQVYSTLTREYSNKNEIVEHFYHKDMQVPIWGIFEVITLGNFSTFVSCLDKDVKRKISLDLKLNQSIDTKAILTEKIINVLKDLRNAIAHNGVVFDCRFKGHVIDNSLKQCLETDTQILNITFDTIVDYAIIIVYLLKNLDYDIDQINVFANEFEKTVNEFKSKEPINIHSKILYEDTKSKLKGLKNYINSIR